MVGTSCSTTTGKRAAPEKYPFLAHTNKTEVIAWRKFTGPDFDVFYGQPKNTKLGGFGIYRGGHPQFHPDEENPHTKGRLGAFDVDWYETLAPDQVYRATVFDHHVRIHKLANPLKEFRFAEKVHAWVYGPNQQEVARLTQVSPACSCSKANRGTLSLNT